MKTVRAIFSLPLLAKELTEIAARRRTYVTRVVYALLLITFFLAINHSTFRNMSLMPLYAMGMGQIMFEMLIFLQLVGICLFLPAFAAGLITQEKERDSLALLFLTELSPWQILLQKFASALISILPFMLIGMPLAALSYAYGGISPQTLFRGMWRSFSRASRSPRSPCSARRGRGPR
jgi:ABC-type transport system involved in multi-copper enzyme maturation permease subunit